MYITCPGCGFTALEEDIAEDAAAYALEHAECSGVDPAQAGLTSSDYIPLNFIVVSCTDGYSMVGVNGRSTLQALSAEAGKLRTFIVLGFSFIIYL